MAQTHSPAPWHVFPDGKFGPEIHDGWRARIATVDSIYHTAQVIEANATLMAAAPELYDLLNEFVGSFARSEHRMCDDNDEQCHECRWQRRAEPILAKARGDA